MFSTQHAVVGDIDGYDFNKSENAARWKGLFIPLLKKVLEQVHRGLTAKEDALLYVETLCLRILAMLCAKPYPHSVQDIEDKVRKSFPSPIDCWALSEAKETINSKKRKSVLPTDRVHSLLQKDVLQYKIDSSVSLFLVAVLEYISADILKLAANYVRKIKHCEITKEDIEVAMCADKVLMDMFYQCDIKSNVLPSPLPTLPAQRTSRTYEEVVKDLIHDEKQYQRDLHMIIRVFREELIKIVRDPRELEAIFSNILDVYEVTVTLLGSLEDVIEMSQEQSAPCVGSCFEELAEAEEFDVYTKYAHEVTSQESKDALSRLLGRPEAISLMSAGHGFREAVKYFLPKLLLVPIWHAFVYFEYIKLLMELSPSQDDIESFEQVQGLLRPLRCDLENIMAMLPNFSESCVPMSSRARRQLAIERTRELQNTVEHWDKDVGQNCNEFIREDSLGKLGSGKRIAERKVFLFDGLMMLCKPNTKRQAPGTGAPAYDYRLKEKFFMRRVEINDRADTEELKNSFEIAPRLQPPIILTAKTQQHKNDWMADLIMVNTKSMLDRILDSILLDIEKKHPLRMPSPDIYKFAIPDSADNIVLEERESAGVPLIKGATLCKLIERLTYHLYADPMFVRTFLTTYRYFCSPQNLLELLIERFDIPDPSLVYQDNHHSNDKDASALNCDTDKMHKNSQREDWKRYRKEYVQPVQFRVLNVLRHWVDHHFYDFEKDPSLLEKLLHFLENINGKSMRKWVDSVLKIVQRKNEQETSHKQITFAYGHSPPPIEHHLTVPESEMNLLTLHPLELARQLTLLEFEMYKNVKPSELVGSPWTKKDKELKSPNLLKIMKHTTNVTRWIEKSIIEAENYDERVAMVTRAIEVMMVMLELNNFNGILSISAAMGSASVYRLKLTFKDLPPRYEKFLEECRELNDGQLKKYQKRLRSINPPCVPFFGRYLTNILHLEEGNPDFLANTELINFSKRRKVSEIIGEIQQYQNQPYCLLVDAKIRSFLENLDPFKGMSDTDISNHLYHESLRIEPRGCKQPPKFPRKWANLSLKSPGIKPRHKNNNNASSAIHSSLSFSSRILHPQAPSETSSLAGDHSPPGHSNIQQQQHGNNPHAFSVFANVNIPERNGSIWSGSMQTLSSTGPTTGTPVHKIDESQCELNGEVKAPVPQLPKKPSSHIWGAAGISCGIAGAAIGNAAGLCGDSAAFSPVFGEIAPAKIDAVWSLPDDLAAQQTPVMLINNNNNPFVGGNDAKATAPPLPPLPPSPLPKLVVSPRHEISSQQATTTTDNRSPFQCGSAQSCKSNCSSSTHFSPTDSICGNSAVFMSGGTSPQLAEIDFNNPTVVPISPHVNVPTASHVEYRAVPPPLPPRRKERTESCAELAQKRQAPDAPMLPPRDGELSPPPIPPRLNHSIATYPAHTRSSHTNELIGKNSLLLPNTSSIMIRRNSEIERRTKTPSSAASTSASSSPTAAGATPSNTNLTSPSAVTITLNPSTSPAERTLAPPPPPPSSNTTKLNASKSNATSSTTTTTSTATSALPPIHLYSLSSNTANINLTADEQSISPALSSSTTTSPMTPMTPISPHIPSGYQMSDTQNSNNMTTNYQQQHQHHHHYQPSRYKQQSAASTEAVVGAQLPQHHTHGHNIEQQLHNHHHHHHHYAAHGIAISVVGGSISSSSGGGVVGVVGHQLCSSSSHSTSSTIPPLQLPPRTSPKDFFAITPDGTHKLPPKPSLSANFYNSEKGTMFLYPSTNQE